MQAQQERELQEERRYQEQLEQERQDRELALRLAQESNGQLEDSPPLIRKLVSFFFLVFFFNAECPNLFWFFLYKPGTLLAINCIIVYVNTVYCGGSSMFSACCFHESAVESSLLGSP